MWENIFGKKQSKTKAEELSKQKKSGKYKIYPILKPGNWVGIKAGALYQIIAGKDEDPEVVLGYGYNTPTDFIFLTYKDLEKRNIEEIRQEAFNNLENFKTDFKYVEQLDNKVITSNGFDFSCEKIFSKAHMQKAHKMLGSNEILVSIPRRSIMMIMAKNQSREMLETFIGMHQNIWKKDTYGLSPIANMLFNVKDGAITNHISLEKK